MTAMGDSGVDDLNDSFLQRRRPIEFTELLDSAISGYQPSSLNWTDIYWPVIYALGGEKRP